MVWLKKQINNKKQQYMLLFSVVVSASVIYHAAFSAFASEARITENVGNSIVIDLSKTISRFENGRLNIPESFQKELALYHWITAAVDWYVSESGIEDNFYCNLKSDILYGGDEVTVSELGDSKRWEYPIENESEIEFKQDSYKLKLEGREHVLYIDINIQEQRVYIYPAELWYVLEYAGEGKKEACVESDWEDIERIDDHFAGVSLEELHNLEYLKIPDDIGFSANVYLSVAGILKRYMEEQQMNDVFYFDVEKDIVSSVTNMIFTCRLRGQEHTLYMDIDMLNMKCHVYEVED